MTRATGVAGLIGLIVSVSGLAARLPISDLHGDTRDIAGALFAAAATVLLGAIAMVVLGVLKPSAGKTTAMSEIRSYPNWAWITKRSLEVEGHLMRGAVESLGVERERNERKARWLFAAYICLMIGVGCLAADALILLYQKESHSARTARTGTTIVARASGSPSR
jgi:hypothetical protein